MGKTKKRNCEKRNETLAGEVVSASPDYKSFCFLMLFILTILISFSIALLHYIKRMESLGSNLQKSFDNFTHRNLLAATDALYYA